ncbi:MAG: lytic transglycosylase domain-containing protein [Alphaproteobacteria bacterium]|nr:lytic transglycosylase domain-containing protein [Alphaproteobacteria bacterium]
MRLTTCASAALALLAVCGVARAEMALPGDYGAAASVPATVLTPTDASYYQQAFAAVRACRMDDADALLEKVSDPVLRPYVLADKYLASCSSATLSELVEWLRTYPDAGPADRIYRLAVSKASKRIKKRHKPAVIVMTASVPVPAGPPRKRGGGYEEFDEPDPPLSSAAGQAARGTIEAYIRADQPDQANATLRQAQINGASDYDLARLAARVSASYLTEGEDQAAYDTAMGIRGDIRQAVPSLDWYAGFAKFRLGDYEEAATRLEALAVVQTVPNYLRSQAAFWASRARIRTGDPQRVIALLTAAAREEPTFYGLLAARVLGLDTGAGFREAVLTSADLAAIAQSTTGRRALALLQVGEDTQYAAIELNRSFGDSTGGHDMGYAALARRVGSPNLELRASETAARSGVLLTGLFPVPPYKPDGGYTLDPSLVLAFVRAESRFMPEVVSHAGARGLLQLMPSAALKFGGTASVAMLNDASYNMAVGQRYLAYLLNQYSGSLIYTPGAYNAGTGRVTGWINARAGKEDDALTFIESIRISETRYYVKRVLMYHWMYSRRMNQPAPSLTQTAAGAWPIYRAPAQPPMPHPPAVQPPPSATSANTVISDARY